MNTKQVHRYIGRYLETTGCRIIEKSPAHYMVKLSPHADRELTNRPYYWSFVDRTGAEPETMSYLFVTDKERYDTAQQQQAGSQAGQPPAPAVPMAGTAMAAGTAGPALGAGTAAGTASTAGTAEAALARSMGYVHSTPNIRIPREDIYFGSRRLDQLFDAAQAAGSYVCLFQEPALRANNPLASFAYTPWLGINYKVAFECDRKREEIHTFGISLATGHFEENFHQRLASLRMTPKLPPNVHVAPNGISLAKAAAIAETMLERKLKAYDYTWAEEAAERLLEEQACLKHYYEPLLNASTLSEEELAKLSAQFEAREAEITWQYEPRMTASAINCGIFYLEGIG